MSQGWSATQVAEALEREPHTIGNWLDRGIHQPSVVAQRATELLSSELGQSEPLQRTRIQRFLGPVDKAVGKFVTWVGLIKAIDFLRGL